MIKNHFTTSYPDANILYFDEDSDNAIFNCNRMDNLNKYLNNINFDNNFDEDDLDTIIYVRLLAWRITFE